MDQQPEHQDDEPVDESLTQLVSYLDGELDETQMNVVEQRLIQDPDMRSHADILSRTWGLLDSLEEVSASKQFTQQTLATISTEVVSEPSASSGALRKTAVIFAKYRILPSFLIGLIGAAVGLMISSRIQERRMNQGAAAVDRVIIDNLPLLRATDLYDLVPDAATLKRLELRDGTAKPIHEEDAP